MVHVHDSQSSDIWADQRSFSPQDILSNTTWLRTAGNENWSLVKERLRYPNPGNSHDISVLFTWWSRWHRYRQWCNNNAVIYPHRITNAVTGWLEVIFSPIQPKRYKEEERRNQGRIFLKKRSRWSLSFISDSGHDHVYISLSVYSHGSIARQSWYSSCPTNTNDAKKLPFSIIFHCLLDFQLKPWFHWLSQWSSIPTDTNERNITPKAARSASNCRTHQ